MFKTVFLLSFNLLFFVHCKQKASVPVTVKDETIKVNSSMPPVKQETGVRAIHVFVALCDNKYQGIVPVPSVIGNGQDPGNNLYWGAGYGIKSYFKNKSQEWKLIATRKNPAENILERLLFRHVSKNVYLLADAYDGKFIRKTTIDFLQAASGENVIEETAGDKQVLFGGAADMVAYIGHDGLMDFSLDDKYDSKVGNKKDAIILACYSRKYFSSHLKSTGATPLLWTSGLMAPEAYTLHDAIREWVNKNSSQAIRTAAAKAYSKYQKCGFKAAENLLVQGW